MNDGTQNAQPDFNNRRRLSSIPKLPNGPRPMDYGGGKRCVKIAPARSEHLGLTCHNRSVSNSVVNQYNTAIGAPAAVSQDPDTYELSINDISRISFASIVPRPSHDAPPDHPDLSSFLEPTFNFDDFHDHITTSDPNLNNFPLPGGAGSIQLPDETATPQPKKFVQQRAIPIPTRKGSQVTTNLSRKPSTASSTTSRVSSKSDPMSNTQTQTQSILRGRRQSQFPPNSFNNQGSTRAPRKSIGPGTFIEPEGQEKVENVKRRPSVGSRKSSNENKSGLSFRLVNRKRENSAESKTPTRTNKTKSFLAPQSQSSNDLLMPRTPDPKRPTSSHNPQTPNRRSGTPGRTTTPGAANRRMSVMPSHASGLGARTISPTDARRMKRMSMVPPAPPLPQSRISQAPPTPQPEPLPNRPPSTAISPAAANRKSLTPSSSRTTPDPNRKSYSSGQSLS